MRFEIAADTDRGIVKETNQDSLLVKCFSTCKGDMAFAVLCDGMPDSTPQAVVWNCIVFVLWSYCSYIVALFQEQQSCF